MYKKQTKQTAHSYKKPQTLLTNFEAQNLGHHIDQWNTHISALF